MAVEFELLRTRATSWRPAEARVALNARMDARIVPDSSFCGMSGAAWAGTGSCPAGAQGPSCLPPGGAAQPTAGARPVSSAASGAGGAGGCSAGGGMQQSGSAAEPGKGCRDRDGGGGVGTSKGPGLSGAGARLHYTHVVVLDDFVGEAERGALLDLLTAPGWDHTQVRAASHGLLC